ncbi:heparinase II/III family protein [Palleronia sp. LCG004]|uniref:heparinase II/III family protein n=1 Tax=Palleronia sp. LCG004 TaxID=3079304 RepID=UPI00294398E0|nr:heparinase II/III family protein [Palleronia sp. LCG004]WOI55441.1 heparinase II/III family protein [Palleronia sp. LCG004]
MPRPTPPRSERLAARLAVLSRGARGFTRPGPEPRTVGSVERGAQIVAGRFLFRGYMVEAQGRSIWDLPLPDDPEFEAELHGCAWLDDLAAEGSARAGRLSREWVHDWARRFGAGGGPGWRADLTGRRVAGWIAHGEMLLEDVDPATRRRFFRSLSRQVAFLSRRLRHVTEGRDRLDALHALLLAGLHLEGHERHRDRAAARLAAEADRLVDAEGGVAWRNPEDLSEIFVRLAHAAEALRNSGCQVPGSIDGALGRAAPVLRALRHADGSLARFHGGGRGVPGRLDAGLACTGRARPAPDRAMGFARIAHGRTTLIVDAAAPPEGSLSSEAHASTLAFELTSGRRPIIVSCGAGRSFGPKWRRAARATASHSTLAIDGYSSARIGGEDGWLSQAPRDVRMERRRDETSTGLVAGHDGYVPSHGLTHIRQLHLDQAGRSLSGEDVLATVEREDEAIFDRAMEEAGQRGFPFAVRFHLHPDIVAQKDEDPGSVLLMTKGGELWVFRHGGRAAVTIEPSVYLDSVSLSPRPTRQIVLSTTAVDYATRVSWTLAKARQTPDAVRDLVHDENPVLA